MAAVPVTMLLAPFAAGQTGKVIEGYNVAPTGRPCQAGNPPDHCANQRDGFDIQPSDQTEMRVLAPVGGTVVLAGCGAVASPVPGSASSGPASPAAGVPGVTSPGWIEVVAA